MTIFEPYGDGDGSVSQDEGVDSSLDKRVQIRLSRPVIVRAALEIIDREGLPGLSMRGLGSQLHVEGMTLYRYFPQKEAILDQVVELVLDGVGLPCTSGGWSSDLRNAAFALRERLLLHPNVMPLVASRWSRIPVLRSLEVAAVDEMVSAGFDDDTARMVMSAIMSLVLGDSWIGVEGYVGELPDSGGLTRKPVAPLAADPGDSTQEIRRKGFERGLDLLLDGAGNVIVSQ